MGLCWMVGECRTVKIQELRYGGPVTGLIITDSDGTVVNISATYTSVGQNEMGTESRYTVVEVEEST